MYRLKIVEPNIRHKNWWWNGKPFSKFETIDELVGFMMSHIPMSTKDIKCIYENDKKKQNGRLACTLWYEVEKGEHGMTEYTSF